VRLCPVVRLGAYPAKPKVRKLCESINELTGRRFFWLDPEQLVGRLNRRTVGWANYFCLGPVSRAYRAVDRHVADRLRRWLCRKHKVRVLGIARFPIAYLADTLGLVRLWRRTHNLPWAKA
jgi:RNA-directed DNA polymerase